jgi:hypothetical protein
LGGNSEIDADVKYEAVGLVEVPVRLERTSVVGELMPELELDDDDGEMI